MNNWSLHREDLMTPQEWSKLRIYLNAQAELAGVRGGWTAIQDRAICLVAVWTGLRRTELTALDVTDLHLTNENPYIVVRHGKGDKFREVIISPRCRSFLKNFLQARAVSNKQSPALFIPQRGDRYTPDGIYRVWKSACAGAGVPVRSIHKARHLMATLLYKTTKDIRLVQKQLGHARITTSQIYADVCDETATEGMKALDKELII